MPEILKALLLGVVQGVTEFLPISSSAHLLALETALDFHLEGLAFDVSLHLATLVAVVLYFRRDLRAVLQRDRIAAVGGRIAIATIPVGIAGFLLGSFREGIAPAFAVGGWLFSATYLLLSKGKGGERRYGEIPISRALGIGCAQALSIFPGVSRSGATIASGLWLGLKREEAARFSFLLAVPAMLGAGLHEGLKLAKAPAIPGELLLACAVGAPAALLVGLGAIHVLLKVVRSSTFHRFGWYNLCAAILFGVYLLAVR